MDNGMGWDLVCCQGRNDTIPALNLACAKTWETILSKFVGIGPLICFNFTRKINCVWALHRSLPSVISIPNRTKLIKIANSIRKNCHLI